MESTLAILRKSKKGFYDPILETLKRTITIDPGTIRFLATRDPGLTWHYVTDPHPLSIEEEAFLDQSLSMYSLNKRMSLKGQIGALMMRAITLDDVRRGLEFDQIVDLLGHLEYKRFGKSKQTVSENVETSCKQFGIYLNGEILTTVNYAKIMKEKLIDHPESISDVKKIVNFVMDNYIFEPIIATVSQVMYQRREIGWWYDGNVVMADCSNRVISLPLNSKAAWSTAIPFEDFCPQLESLFRELPFSEVNRLYTLSKQAYSLYLQRIMQLRPMKIGLPVLGNYLENSVDYGNGNEVCYLHATRDCSECVLSMVTSLFGNDHNLYYRVMDNREAVFVEYLFLNYLKPSEQSLFVKWHYSFSVIGFSLALFLLFKAVLDIRDEHFVSGKRMIICKSRVLLTASACRHGYGYSKRRISTVRKELVRLKFNVDGIIETALRLICEGMVKDLACCQYFDDPYVARTVRMARMSFNSRIVEINQQRAEAMGDMDYRLANDGVDENVNGDVMPYIPGCLEGFEDFYDGDYDSDENDFDRVD